MANEKLCTRQFSASEAFELSFYTNEAPDENTPRVFPRHMHDAIEVLILLNGACSFSVESELYAMRSGDAVIISPNEAHNCIIQSHTPFQHLCFWITLAKDGMIGEMPSFCAGGTHCVTLQREALSRVQGIAKELKGSHDPLKQRILALEFLWIMQNSHPTEKLEMDKVPTVLRRILTDIDENFQKIDRLEYLTDKYYISKSTLGRLFRTHLHTTPKQYLEAKRLAYSRMLLKQGYCVLDASVAAGFPDYSNYIRLFRRRFGMTPKQYQSAPPFEIALQPGANKARSTGSSQEK